MAASQGLENVNPEIHQKATERTLLAEEEDDNVVDKFDQREVFGILLYAQTLLLGRKLSIKFVMTRHKLPVNSTNFLNFGNIIKGASHNVLYY